MTKQRRRHVVILSGAKGDDHKSALQDIPLKELITKKCQRVLFLQKLKRETDDCTDQ
jgi:hypothetical protein